VIAVSKIYGDFVDALAEQAKKTKTGNCLFGVDTQPEQGDAHDQKPRFRLREGENRHTDTRASSTLWSFEKLIFSF